MTTTLAATAADHYLAAFERAKESLPPGEPEGAAALRRRAIQRFGELGFPTPRMEQWRFTNVAPIARTPFEVEDGGGLGLPPGAVEALGYPGLARLVLVNGRPAPGLGELGGLPSGVLLTDLGSALSAHAALLEPFLGRLASFDEATFVALNTAFLGRGAFLYVPRGVVVERPVHVLSVGRPGDRPLAFFPRLLVVAEEGSQVTVVEDHASAGPGAYLNCPVTEIALGPGAVVDHYKLQRESVDAFHMATLAIEQGRNSSFSCHSISWGGDLVRNDFHARLAGEGADAILNGLYMVEGRQLVDNHMRVEHIMPHCSSHELFKGILDGRSRAVFSGLIHVHPGAQKTDAKQTNRNLLLSRDALCNSHPQLEIFADDVKCTHGSTVGRLDRDAVFYLRSRGISEEAARSLLTYAFASDIVERIKVTPVRRDLEEFLFRRLPRGEVVRQAV